MCTAEKWIGAAAQERPARIGVGVEEAGGDGSKSSNTAVATLEVKPDDHFHRCVRDFALTLCLWQVGADAEDLSPSDATSLSASLSRFVTFDQCWLRRATS